jgi:hypothetical protein
MPSTTPASISVQGPWQIADCVNPWPLTRRDWHAVAERAGVAAIDVEVICSDSALHRARAESRVADLDGHRLPSWHEIATRDYRPWGDGDRLVLDTARLSVDECVREIRSVIRARRGGGVSAGIDNRQLNWPTANGREATIGLPAIECPGRAVASLLS